MDAKSRAYQISPMYCFNPRARDGREAMVSSFKRKRLFQSTRP